MPARPTLDAPARTLLEGVSTTTDARGVRP